MRRTDESGDDSEGAMSHLKALCGMGDDSYNLEPWNSLYDLQAIQVEDSFLGISVGVSPQQSLLLP